MLLRGALLQLLLMLLLLAPFCAVGVWIGSGKDRTIMGAVLGVLGIVGWLIIAVVPRRPSRGQDPQNAPSRPTS